MAKFNKTLKEKLQALPVVKQLVAAMSIPTPNTTNLQGHEAYALDKQLRLLAMLNTLKLEPQFYRTESEAMNDLLAVVDECAKEDAYFVAQAIVYSRCVRPEGMRSINQLAAVRLANYAGGQAWAKRFYSLWNKRQATGGCIYRADDMAEMVAAYKAINGYSISNAMKKGFREALEQMDTYTLLKYKKVLIDVINLVHPNPNRSTAMVAYNGVPISTLTAIMQGYSVSAETWEVAQSEAGQVVAQAVKEGKLTKEAAADLLQEAKSENWEQLLADGKLNILAALRNLRNILLNKPSKDTIDSVCRLLSDGNAVLKGKIMPYQLDLANEVMTSEFSDANARRISKALLEGYVKALPNLAELLKGKNLVIVDFSGSMTTPIVDANRKTRYQSTCANKAALIAATICQATNADLIRFGSTAEWVRYSPNADVFSLAKTMQKDMGATSLAAAWQLASQSRRVYDRVFILSDNECNRGSSYEAYKGYVEKVGDPYVYSVNLAAYGTTQLAGNKVRYYYGYGYGMFSDIATHEFNPAAHFEQVKQVKI